MGVHLNKDKFYRHWQRQYHHLLDRQDRLLKRARSHGLPEHIHELRVVLRRLRLMVRVSSPPIDREAARRYRQWSRQISDVTSPLRDIDVTLEWLASQKANPALADTLQTRRQSLWSQGRRKFMPPPQRILAATRRLKSNKHDRQRLRRRYPARFARLHARVVSQIPHFFELNDSGRHAFRRTIRLLRYLRESALTERQRHHDALLKALAEPQAAMGEYQNVTLARQIVGSLHSPAPSNSLRQTLRRDQAHWQRHIKTSLRVLAQIYRSQAFHKS